MKEAIPQLTICNSRKTNGVSEEKKLNEMRSSCEKCSFFSSQSGKMVIRKVFFLFEIVVLIIHFKLLLCFLLLLKICHLSV